MHLFYAEEIKEGTGKLGKEESHHAQRVLRLKAGDLILTTLGQGTIYSARVMSVGKTELIFSIIEKYSEEVRKNYLHIAIAPTKSLDRFEFFLEKATEAGVDEITPVIGFHSERKIYKTERGKKIIKAAAKQSLSNYLPVLNEAKSLQEFLQTEHSGSLWIAHCDEKDERKEILRDISQSAEITVLIGPEGDFSKEEVLLAKKNNFHAISLGPKRLRTETAGIAVAFAGKIF